ncbi:MAG: hypothetical protein GY856_12205 [bacterium]|nr:hypothetical protein [bacterium]
MKLEQCTLNVAALLLNEIRQVLELPLVQLEDLIKARLGDAALVNLQDAINVLYLLGLVEYNDAVDLFFYIEPNARGGP